MIERQEQTIQTQLSFSVLATKQTTRQSTPGTENKPVSPSKRSDRLWGPTSVLRAGYRIVSYSSFDRRRRVHLPAPETDHSPPSRTEVKNKWRYTCTPPMRPPPRVQRGNFDFVFTFPNILSLPHSQCSPNCTVDLPEELQTPGPPLCTDIHTCYIAALLWLLQTASYKYSSTSLQAVPWHTGEGR